METRRALRTIDAGLEQHNRDQDAALQPCLSLILPVYNEEGGIPALLDRLAALLREIRDLRVEVIFVDDHSTDESSALLRAACERYERYRYLRLARNRGSHIAILAGLAHARGDCAVFLASDLQDPPELIPRMLGLWRAGDQVVWAVRERREGVSRREQLLARIFYWLMNCLSDVAFPPQGADFALLDRLVIDALLQSAGSNPSLGGAIAWLGFRQTQITYTKAARQFGRSKWSFGKRLKAVADAFVAFSFVPIRFMAYIGIAMGLLGFVYACVIIILRLVSKAPIEGWASLMVVVLVIGGIQMTMLGVLGEYLWRSLEEARKRPLYFLELQQGFEVEPIAREHGS